MLGSNPKAQLSGIDRLPGRTFHFEGKSGNAWHSDATYERVRDGQIYPGVDLIYYGSESRLEYDFVVAPGADVNRIRLAVGGAKRIELDAAGNLVVAAGDGEITLHRPFLYQQVGNTRRQVSGGFRLNGGQVSFQVGEYDATLPLVIDPVLNYATYVGGGINDRVTSVAIGPDGSAYLAGTAAPSSSQKEAFVAHLSADGKTLLYMTYLGGSGATDARGIALDAAGSAYITGQTKAADFPILNALQTACGLNGKGQCADAFVAKLNADGSLNLATYLGGDGEDSGNAIALDDMGNIYIAGGTASSNFPVFHMPQSTLAGREDGFVAKIAGDGSQVVYATYLGGAGDDTALGIALDSKSSAYITGRTQSFDFPTRNALQSQCRPDASGQCAGEAFAAKLSPDGGTLVYSTYLGGSGGDTGNSIAVDASGSAYLAGNTKSPDFPLAGAFQGRLHGASDAFAAKLTPDGAALVYSTYLGGSGDEAAVSLAIDRRGRVFISGHTNSPDFPTQGPVQGECRKESNGACSEDGFLLVLNTAGSGLWFSSYLGGTGPDEGRGLALDGKGSVYLGGATGSPDFPTAKVMNAPAGTPFRRARPNGQMEVAVEGSASPDTSPSTPHHGGFIAKLGGMGDPQQACTGSESISWVGGVDLKWSTAGNWSTGNVPISTDTVCIDTAFATTTLTIGQLAAANQTIATLLSNANIILSGGPLTVTGGANFVNALSLSTGTLTLAGTNGSSVGTTLTLSSSSVLAGTDTVTVTGVFNWQGGSLCTVATCTAPAGAQAILNANGGISDSSANNYKSLLGRTLNNSATTTLNSTSYYMQLGYSSVINNLAAGTWNIAADTQSLHTTTGGGTFNNAGLFEKTATTGTSSVSPVFTNTGSVQANSGTLNFTALADSSASWSVATAATLGLSAGTGATAALSGTIAGTGTAAVNFGANGGAINLAGSSYDVAGGTAGIGGTTNFSGTTTRVGTVTVNNSAILNFTTPLANNPGALTVSDSGVVNFSTGSPTPNTITIPTLTLGSSSELTGTDTVTVTGLFSWMGGSVCTVAACTAPAGAQAILNANGGISDSNANLYKNLLGRTLNNSGIATLNSTSYYMQLGYSSVVNNLAAGTWNIAADPQSLHTTTGGGTFNNAGLFEKTVTTGTSSVSPVFNNTGSVQANSGTLSFLSSFTQTAGSIFLGGGSVNFTSSPGIQGGTIGGSGTISGTYSGSVSTDPAGALAPGVTAPSPVAGSLSLTGSGSGNYTQGAGAFDVKIGGTASGEYDTVSAAGSAQLGGILNVGLIGGFSPVAGNSFTILTANSLGGSKFASTRLPTLSAGNGWQVNYNTNSVVLSVVSVSTPVVTLGATSQNFPNTIVGKSSATFTVTLQNTGTAPLTIASIVPTGVDGADYSYSADPSKPCPISPATLGNGAVCTLDVTFTPLSAGAHNSAQLTITDNNGLVAGSTQSVALTGLGTVLSSIQITAPNSSIVSAGTDQFTATGTYSDNSTANLTSQAAWNSSNTAAAAIAATGLATGAATGTSNITSSFAGVTSNIFVLTVTASVPASIAIFSGNGQNATVNTVFAGSLVALVRDAANNPVPNATVSFSAPGSGAGGTFANGTANATALTDAAGHASSPVFTANTISGAYPVTAVVSTFSTNFGLTNTPGAAASVTAAAGSGQTASVSTVFTNPLQATVKDAYGNLVSGVSVAFTAPSGAVASATFSNTTNSIAISTTGSGQASAALTANSTAGSYIVSASAAGVAVPASFSLTNVPGSPAFVTVSSGSGQSASIDTAFGSTLVAQVTDSAHNPVAGVTVTFAAPTQSQASGAFAGGVNTATTTAQGLATSALFTANAILGTYSVAASVSGVPAPANFSLTNKVGAPAFIAATGGSGQSATINTPFDNPLRATVTDVGGNPVSGATVTFAAPVSGSGGAFAGGVNTAITNAQGQASAAVFTANGTAGAYSVTATVTGASAPAGFTLTNRGAASVAVSAGSPQSAGVGGMFASPLAVLVQDSAGNPVSGVTVTFVVPSNGPRASFAGGVNTAVTNGSGVATSVALTANMLAGGYTVSASAPGVAAPASFSLTNLVGATASVAVAPGTTPQSATVNSPFSSRLAAVVADGFGNPVSGVTVSFLAPATGAGGTFAGGLSNAVTDATGTAVAPVFTANSTAGSYVVTATVPGVAGAATFSLTNSPSTPAAVVTLAGGNQNALVSTEYATQFRALVLDVDNNPIPNVAVTFAAPGTGASGSFAGGGTSFLGTTDATGQATAPFFTANTFAGTYTVTASVAGVATAADFLLKNTAGAAGSIVSTGGTLQTTTVNTPFGAVFQVTVEDSDGNLVPNASVTFTAPGSGASGTFAGSGNTFTGTTNASGMLMTPAFTANTMAGIYQLTAVTGSLSTSFNLTNAAASPAAVSASAGTPQSAQIGTQFANRMQALVLDSFSNPVANVAVTFAAPTTGASGTFAGGGASFTGTTNASGVVMAPAFTANTIAAGYVVTASAAGVAGPADFALANLPGAPGSIVSATGSSQTTVILTGFTTPLNALVKDADGNPVPNVTVTFTAPATGASGMFSGGSAAITAITDATGTASAGILTANSIAGLYHVTASAPGVAAIATFQLINTAGTAATITASAGALQSAVVDAQFATSLQATVVDAYNNPVPDLTVTFTAPASGASGMFAGGTNTAQTDSLGRATASAFTANDTTGAYTVTASAPGVATLAGFSLTNTPATLVSLAVTPANPSIVKGQTQQFIATGTYSDSSTQNLTNSATWTSATPAAATIVAGGLATGVGIGTSTIGASAGAIGGSTVLTVTAATLVSLAVTPANPSIVKGQTQQFIATGTYSDSSTQNLTNSVTWTSATPAAATIVAGGLATGVGVGTSTISASAGAIGGSTVLTVTAATLVSLAVTPANPSIVKGQTQQFIATGTYSDSSTQNLTNSATWTSATPAAATIVAGGLATGVGVGTSTISATAGAIGGSTVLTVTSGS
ncbi:MAG TPA: SBBP repeat-containing protein, partial [Bryobacteraceae bacterium]|nr:SBBP repeat-containing protein [Bryobacteraceae bacterium]